MTFDGRAVQVRMFVSPLFTVVASVFEVLLGWRRGVPDEWITLIRDRSRGLELAPLRSFDGAERTVPNFLLPLPPSSSPTFEEELEALRRTPRERIETDFAGVFGDAVPEQYTRFLTATEESLDDVCVALSRYWKAAFQQSWPQMRAVLEREVMLTGREIVTKGTSAVLQDLNARIAVRSDHLRYPSPQHETAEIPLGARVMALIPMICGPRGLMTSEDRDDAVVIAYAARGVGAVWQRGGTDQGAALASLIGPGRARVIQALGEPTTTSGLASSLKLSAATASHHLTGLVEQGLARRERIGTAVYYSLTPRGESLLNLFGD